MDKIGIIGLGLLGGSIAVGLKSKRDDIRIAAMDTSLESLQVAHSDGIVDEYATCINEIFKGCRIIFVCTPVHMVAEHVRLAAALAGRDCIITDVGSTKAAIYDEINGTGICYIGGHPMAGSEKTGYQNAKAHLFENAYYVLTPLDGVSDENLEYIKEIVRQLGAIPVVMASKHHDLVVSAISHAPHIIASALVNTVEQLDDDSKYMYQLAAGGFKDVTRIASGSPEIWLSIAQSNKEEILKTIAEFKNILESFENKLMKNDSDAVYDFFEKAKVYRDSFAGSKAMSIHRLYDVLADVVDEPGSIAQIANILNQNSINIKNIGIINNREYQDGVLQILFDSEGDRQRCIGILNDAGYKLY